MSQLEIDIAEYILCHQDALRQHRSVSPEVYSRYKVFVDEEYETFLLDNIKEKVADGLNIFDKEAIECIINKEWIVTLLGKDWFKYEI